MLQHQHTLKMTSVETKSVGDEEGRDEDALWSRWLEWVPRLGDIRVSKRKDRLEQNPTLDQRTSHSPRREL
jgi:hypothetical protein